MLVDSSRKLKLVDIDYGVVTVARTKRRHILPRNGNYSSDQSEDIFDASISFLPRNSDSKSKKMFTFSFHRHALHDRILSTIPRLAVNNVLPADSAVFTVVKSGQFDIFQEMLRDGKASLRDHDEYGRSLLSVIA
jgi:hypothetical protein